jgi:hypothetical protein
MAEITGVSNLGGTEAAVVSLVADASQYDRAMDRAADSMRRWEGRVTTLMERASRTIEKESGKATATLKERFDSVNDKVDRIGGAFGFSLKMALADLATQAGRAFVDMVSGADKAKKELEKLEKGYTDLAASMDKLADKRAERLDRGLGREDTLKRTEKELADLKNKLKASSATRDAATAERKRSEFAGGGDDIGSSAGAAFRWLGGMHEKTLALKDAVIKGEEAISGSLKERIDALEEAKLKLSKPSEDFEFKKSLEETNDALKRAGETWNLNAEQLAVYELRLKGANEEQVKAFELAQKAAARGDLLKSIREREKALEKEAATWGRTADEIAIYELRLKGATDADVAHLKKLQEEAAERLKIDEARKAIAAEAARPTDWNRATGAARGGSSAAAEAIAAARRSTAASALDPRNAQLEELRKIAAGTKDAAKVNKDAIDALAKEVNAVRVVITDFGGGGDF